jgi:hypothetical protein
VYIKSTRFVWSTKSSGVHQQYLEESEEGKGAKTGDEELGVLILSFAALSMQSFCMQHQVM